MAEATAPSRARILAAYTTVYVLWGSTYLAIFFAIQTLPPFLMAGARFLVAGALLYGWTRARGAARPSLAQWKAAAVVGALLLLIGNGAVVWAEQRIPSGIAALLVATVPVWMVLLEWLGPDRNRPSGRTIVGVILGIVGVVVLVGPGARTGQGSVDLVGAAALILSALAWAAGSLYARRAIMPATPQLGTAMQMVAGGAMLIIVALAHGDTRAFDFGTVSATSAGALLYLIVFGSLIGFSAYVWLLRVEPPSRVSTHAYVNPVVAVALGWLIADEALTSQTILAAAIIVGAVVLIIMRPRRAERPSVEPATATPPSVSRPFKRRRRVMRQV